MCLDRFGPARIRSNPGSGWTSGRAFTGILTHLYIDPLMRQGLGVMGGTRATQVGGSLADGQILPYPAPVPILP